MAAGNLPSGRPAERGGDAGELPLDLRDSRLPWLDAEDTDEQGGMGRMLAMVGGLLLLLVLAVGGVWYIHHVRSQAAMVADGGIIRAPQQPYKVRPGNAGGNVAPGTGDVRFAVAEGKTSAVRVGGATDLIDADTPALALASGAAAMPASAVQLGAFSTAAEAEAAWPGLVARFPALSGLRHRVIEVKADLGPASALQAVAADANTAQTLCRALKAEGLSCQVKG